MYTRITATVVLTILFAACTNHSSKLTILHTNDTHSHIEPEKDKSGGALNRALLIEHITDSVGRENCLLLDCGDFSQGSLYYNVYKGEIETDLMNAMHYDAGVLGNHEFDFGLDNLAHLLKRAGFPILCANYDFTGTVCEGLTKPYTIIERAGLRIGIFGVSPRLEGLVLKENYEGVDFRSPLEAAQECADTLRAQGCNLVICLSHLGWKGQKDFDDEKIATKTNNIDIILGGHSHNYFEKPLRYKNRQGKEVVIQQTGKYGRHLGTLSVNLKN